MVLHEIENEKKKNVADTCDWDRATDDKDNCGDDKDDSCSYNCDFLFILFFHLCSIHVRLSLLC